MKLQYIKEKTLLPMHIDVEKTIQVFGYDPQFFKPSSERLVVTNCIHCNKEQYKKRRLAIKTALCSSCSNRENAVKGANKRSDSMKLYYQSNPHPLLGGPRERVNTQVKMLVGMVRRLDMVWVSITKEKMAL